jgi:hypothetical protein
LEVESFSAIGTDSGLLAITRVPVSGMPFAQAWRLTTRQATAHPYSVQIRRRIDVAVRKGENCLLSFYLKGEAGESPSIMPVFERASAPWSKALKTVTGALGQTRKRMLNWDVLNEPYSNHDFMDLLGQNAMADWFRQAKALAPDSDLFINDYGILNNGSIPDTEHMRHYETSIRGLLEQGAPLEGIGMQAHMNLPTPPERLLSVLDRYGKFGLPIWITEYDHTSRDEDEQGAYMRDFLTAIFSHPRVEGFLMWGFWDGKHWKSNAPLFRRDWSLKPSGNAYRQLVSHDWWTREKGTTNGQGELEARVFKGNYKLVCRVGEQTVVLHPTVTQSSTLTIRLTP